MPRIEDPNAAYRAKVDRLRRVLPQVLPALIAPTAPPPAAKLPEPMPAMRTPGPEREESPPWPITLEDDQLQVLGELRGRSWFTFAGAGDFEYELLEDRRPLRDADTRTRLADGAVYVGRTLEATNPNGSTYPDRVWYETNRYAAGSFANRGKEPVIAKPRKAAGSFAVDGLAALPALAPKADRITSYMPPRAETIVALPPGAEVISGPAAPSRIGAVLTSGRPVQRGVETILAVVKKIGATVTPCRYGCHVVVSSERGRLAEGGREFIDATAPLLAPAIGCTRSPLADVAANGHCHHPVHEGDHKPVAVTIGPGGVYGSPLCEDCVR